ncbi:PREDICTED: uncharacterized protein LOC105967780 [Erythranthe guttata]|uniref:uncharacterized protein LOC105967780 n=1 Tax=Erythranthe guttata TaxID=4155 RepID=UPI00064DF3F6|nr:PREDICTED: uncharacterized protein LOC105967780 [Erythranthe guttata]|eukprot:XP_012847848.1 PREDICTED: uncharacterized protein LOC105967780 [Erythranthe guttata]
MYGTDRTICPSTLWDPQGRLLVRTRHNNMAFLHQCHWYIQYFPLEHMYSKLFLLITCTNSSKKPKCCGWMPLGGILLCIPVGAAVKISVQKDGGFRTHFAVDGDRRTAKISDIYVYFRVSNSR